MILKIIFSILLILSLLMVIICYYHNGDNLVYDFLFNHNHFEWKIWFRKHYKEFKWIETFENGDKMYVNQKFPTILLMIWNREGYPKMSLHTVYTGDNDCLCFSNNVNINILKYLDNE